MTTSLPLVQRASQHGSRVAIISTAGRFTYDELLVASESVATSLLDGAADLDEARVAFLTPPGFDYAATQWGIWRAGGVAVPLCLLHPRPELEYVVDDAQVAAVVVHPDLLERIRPLADQRTLRVITTDVALTNQPSALPDVDSARRAMILYTSGTTSRPKGVVTTHAHIEAQIRSLVEAWQWTADDHILHVLPLHHIHGIINVLSCALWAGAKCEMLPRFDADEVWRRLARGDLTLFMAVPTIYSKLIAAWERATPEQQQAMSAGCAKMRLMVSGSAALPVTTLETWKSISGHVLLERYGMTEIGMALSNPLEGHRVPGHVGTPLPGVEVRRVDDAGNPLAPSEPGEIEVRGPAVFSEYWGKREATRDAFRDGWFRTLDVAVVERGVYRILGRSSVDIIKTGGYKVSALEIEDVLRTHPDIRECAVVGVPDDEWGESVSACVVLAGGSDLTLESLRTWAKERLAVYKIPQRLLSVDDLPRNAMGKVQKPAVTALFQNKQ